jgi:hypothetical protein
MKPLTPELRKQIEESGVPIIELTLEEFKSSIKGITKEKPYFCKSKDL